MGIRLVAEVLKHAPPALDRAERLVLVTIAEDARDSTRVSHCGRRVLLERTGLGPRGLRHVFERLAARGLEVRVPIGTDRRNRPLYAVPGQQSTYRLPAFSGAKGDLRDPLKGDLGDRQADRGDRQADLGDRQADRGVPPFSQPSVPQQQRPAAHIAIVMKSTGATAEEAEAVAAAVDAEKHPTNLPGFLRRLATDGELGDWLAQVRTERDRGASAADQAAHRARIRREPWCEHGTPGGHIPSPRGWVACQVERARLKRAAETAAGGRT